MSTAEAQSEFGRTLALHSARPTTESSNRRNRKLGVVETSSRSIVPEPARKVVEDACKKALILWPNAKAAILFGSRARGDHRANSDWDIAFVTGKEEPLPDELLRELESLETHDRIIVQGLAISQTRFSEGANSIGNISVPIARDGRLIAGHCEWPTTEGEPIFKPHEYAQWRSSALMHIASASTSLATAIESAREGVDLGDFGWFVARSSDAAELCAKIAFGKITSGTGVAIPRRHQVDEIVETLDRVLVHDAGPSATWWHSNHGKQFRELLCKMNGRGNMDHQFGYPVPMLGAKVITRATNRLIATVSFAIIETEGIPDPGGLSQAAVTAAHIRRMDVSDSARRLRRTLQNLDANDATFAEVSSVLAESALAAVSFGEEITQAIERLADSLHSDTETRERTRAKPIS